MTIINVWITPERALIGTDTEIACPDGSRAHCSKIIPFVHLNAIVAVRGHLFFLAHLVNTVQMANCPDFDTLLEGIGEALPVVLDQTKQNAHKMGMADTSPLESQTAVFVGYSAKAGRMVGREWTQDTPARGFVPDDIAPHFIAPWDRSIDHLPDPTEPGSMARLVVAQTKLMRERAPDAAAGGRLILVEITRDAMQIRPVCEL